MRPEMRARPLRRVATLFLFFCCTAGFATFAPALTAARAETGADGGTPLLLAPAGTGHARHGRRHRSARHAPAADAAPVAETADAGAKADEGDAPAAETRHGRRHVSRRHHGRYAKRGAPPAETDDADATTTAADDKAPNGPASVGMLVSGPGSTSARIATDLDAILARDFVKVQPVSALPDASGAAGADLSLVQADAMGTAKPKARDRLAYVTRLYNSEVQVLAQAGITDIRQLAGKKVGIDAAGSGTATTAQTIFSRLGIKIVPVDMDQPAALELLRTGDLAATVVVAGKPAPALTDVPAGSGIHLLPIPYDAALEDLYYPARLTAADYPNLLRAGDTVDTVAVGTILAISDAEKGSPRYRRLATFTQAFFKRFGALRDPARHPKWQEVNLAAEVPGWKRFGPAQEALDSMPAKAAQAPDAAQSRNAAQLQTQGQDTAAQEFDATAFDRFVASRTGATDDTKLSQADQDRLLKEFQKWKRTSAR